MAAAWLAPVAGLLAGLVDWWGNRFNLNPDGVSYVELAQHAFSNGKIELISGYWSPGYPVLIMPVVGASPSDPAVLIPRLHDVNLLLFGLGLWLFIRLLSETDDPRDHHRRVERLVVATGVFAILGVQGIGLGLLTPDFAVAVVVLATALCCRRIEDPVRSWRATLALGAVLGIGYWIKAILLPLDLLLVLLLLVIPLRAERARIKTTIAGLIMLIIVAPLVVLVSRKTGHLTIGEVGRLNYAWEVDNVTPFVGWLGDSTAHFGRPIHPPRVLQLRPLTLEFATPVRATYPLWFDPSYWYAGAHARFDLRGQLAALSRNFADFGATLLDQWAIVASLIALALATMRSGRRTRERSGELMVVWSLIAFAVYLLVHVESRYLAGFEALCVWGCWRGLRRRTRRPAFAWVVAGSGVAMLLSLALHLRANTGGFDPGYQPDYLRAADTLRRLGVRSGDRLATIGDAFEQYSAFVMSAPIAAQVLDSAGYWKLPPVQQAALDGRLAAMGITALLANNVASNMTAAGWHLLVRADSTNIGMLEVGGH